MLRDRQHYGEGRTMFLKSKNSEKMRWKTRDPAVYDAINHALISMAGVWAHGWFFSRVPVPDEWYIYLHLAPKKYLKCIGK